MNQNKVKDLMNKEYEEHMKYQAKLLAEKNTVENRKRKLHSEQLKHMDSIDQQSRENPELIRGAKGVAAAVPSEALLIEEE